MSRTDWAALISRLRGMPYQRGVVTPDSVPHRIEFDAGLADAEVLSIRERIRIPFPPRPSRVLTDSATAWLRLSRLAFGRSPRPT